MFDEYQNYIIKIYQKILFIFIPQSYTSNETFPFFSVLFLLYLYY